MRSQQLVILFSTVILTIFSLNMLLFLPKNILADENSCISYNSIENLISIACQHAEFIDIVNSLQNPSILQRETSNFNEKNWILNAGINVEKNAILNIDSNDVTWLKIVPSKNTPNAIKVDGSLKVDSVKITSWNPQTNDYVYFSDAVKDDELQYTKELRPYIKVNSGATGLTIIKNSELAYLGYKCSGCGGLTFNGGEYGALINNDIHHIYKGFYSKGMGYMLIEGNRVHNNHKYGIDPHSGTHDMLIINNIVYDNFNAGIICSADCYNILIEGNKVYNNGHGDNMRGIAVSRNVFDSIIKNNIIYNEDKCISIGRNSYNNHIYENTMSTCIYGVYITKDSFENKIHDNHIETVGIGLVAASNSNNNDFHSNTLTDVKIQPTLQDSTSTNNNFDTNKKIVSFDTLKEEKGIK